MKYFHLVPMLFRSKIFLNRSFHIFKTTSTVNFGKVLVAGKNFLQNEIGVHQKNLHIDSDNEELLEDLHVEENEIDCTHTSRNAVLFQNDDIISKLDLCASIEDVLNVIAKNLNTYDDKHITKTVIVLSDLQKIFYEYNGFNNSASNVFFETLKKNEDFVSLLKCIENKLHDFNPSYLSYVLLYLNKLGFSMENQLIHRIALKVRNNLVQDFHLDQCSRFLTAIFSENSVRPYNISNSVIPLVFSHIGKCQSVDDLHSLTLCLNKLHNIIAIEILDKYKANVQEFLENKKLSGTNYLTLLRITLFLNYPQWRDKNILLISECILLLINHIHLLNIHELTVLYEIFFKNQEPGVILDSIQRCSAKFLHHLDETHTIGNNTTIKLFSSLIYFSSPTHRIQFRKHLTKYLNNCHDFQGLIQLRKVFSYIKVSDPKLCAKYWDLCLKMLSEESDPNIILKMCQNYMLFNTDVNNYRHYEFESIITQHIKNSLLADPFLNPRKISIYLTFAILYGKDMEVMEQLFDRFQENYDRINASDCLKISQGLAHLDEGLSSRLFKRETDEIKLLLKKYTKNTLNIDQNDYLTNSMLLRGLLLRKDSDNETLENFMMKFKELDFMSSKIIENISYMSLSSSSLIPELINKCTEYLVKHKNNILGFNAERLLYLCYFLDYFPVNDDKFFAAATDVIIRDQERLSGLSFLQSALSLCYFNQLPSSFIKQIFNVEFLEKLDVELENCYSKDKYPQRVRNVLMVLNRAVCLEYPEYNVPWFHAKYVEDMQKKFDKNPDNLFHQRVKMYLLQALGTNSYVSERQVTSYGYNIDFVVNLNNKDEPVAEDTPNVIRRVALLLLRPHAFTRFYVHLKGKHQLKIRHLEMFGFEVAIVNFNEWINLLYGEERLEYITKLIWPSGKNSKVNVSDR